MKALIDSVQPTLATCRGPLAAIACIVPENQYWRFVVHPANHSRFIERALVSQINSSLFLVNQTRAPASPQSPPALGRAIECSYSHHALLTHLTSQLTYVPRRWKDIWARHVQNAVFVVVLCEYTRSQKLLSIKECSEAIGCTLVSCKSSSSRNNSPPVQSEWKDRVYLQVEDYLHGLVSVVNELSRLAVNSVTLYNYEEPFRISGFVKDVFAGFSMVCQP